MFGGSLWVLPTSSTTKTGHHDIAGILLKVALNTKNQISPISPVLKLGFNPCCITISDRLV
jgi:hypothetical protein